MSCTKLKYNPNVYLPLEFYKIIKETLCFMVDNCSKWDHEFVFWDGSALL